MVAGRLSPKEAVLPIFIMEREILSKDESIKNPVREEEIFHCLIQEVHPHHLRSVQRVGALWRIYLHDRNARAKLLMRGISVRGKHIHLKEENPFSLKSRMADLNAVQITIKELPESADDSVVIEFLSHRGCKIVNNVMRRMIRYKKQLTHCSNGDRMVYIEATPPKYIPRSVKLGSHWANVFYYGQVNIQQHEKKTHGRANEPNFSPASQESIRVIEDTFNMYVEKDPLTSKYETEQTGSKEKEPEMVKEIISQTPEGKGDESPPEAQTLTKEKNNWRKKKMQATESMKINEGRRNKTVKRDTRPNRQRSNSFGSTTKVDISSFDPISNQKKPYRQRDQEIPDH